MRSYGFQAGSSTDVRAFALVEGWLRQYGRGAALP